MSNPHVRNLLGLLLGGALGVSLTVSVLPTALGLTPVGPEPLLLQALAPLWPWTALVGAAGGWSVTRTRGVRAAGIVLAVAGAGAALLATGMTVGGNLLALAVAAAVGAAYGGVGGLILGRILTPAAADDDGGPPL